MSQFKLLDAERIKAETVEARERAARELFDVPTVAKRIVECSAEGFGRLRIRQQRPLRLANTRAADRLTAWLVRCGFQYRWQEVTRRVGKDELASYAELVVEWEASPDLIVEALRDVTAAVDA